MQGNVHPPRPAHLQPFYFRDVDLCKLYGHRKSPGTRLWPGKRPCACWPTVPGPEAETRRRLERRFDGPAIDRTIGKLKALGFLDDAAFAREWRASRERRRPRGEPLLRRELLEKGVAPGVVQEALEGYDAEANAYNAGRRLARRLPLDDCATFRRRLWGRLRRRGFSHEVIDGTVSRLWSELSESLHGDEYADGQEQQRVEAEERLN